MNRILSLIGNIIILCLINTGVIYIDDRMKKIMESRVIHYIRLVSLMLIGVFFITTRAGYSVWGKAFLLEFIIILLINLVDYYEEISVNILLELDILIMVMLFITCFVTVELADIILAALIAGLFITLAYLISELLNIKNVECIEIKFIIICLYTIIFEFIFDFVLYGTDIIYENNNLFNSISGVMLIAAFIIEIIGHAFMEYYNNADETFKKLEYANEQYDVDRVQKMYEETRKVRHDLKQCISSVAGYIESQRYDEALKMLNEISDKRIDAISYKKYCDNKVLNYILNDKYSRCKNSNIDFKCMVLGVIRGIDDIDLCILLGNIIDNAIEAAQKTADGYVNIEITVRGTIFINVENSIKESFLGKENAFVSTKMDKKNHGIGTKSIYGIVNKYCGEIEYEEHGNCIICKVVLPEKNNHLCKKTTTCAGNIENIIK